MTSSVASSKNWRALVCEWVYVCVVCVCVRVYAVSVCVCLCVSGWHRLVARLKGLEVDDDVIPRLATPSALMVSTVCV